jgi:acyl-coenzyme A thioesterase PaaI-like protein
MALPKLTRLDSFDKNVLRRAWDSLAQVPGGRHVFSRMVGLAAPYTGSIGAQVEEVGQGYARVHLEDRRAVRQHLGSVHAIALCNLAELCGNLAVAYSLPDGMRFIVAGLAIDYKKKARGRITATAEIEVPQGVAKADLEVPVILRDAGGDEVARATLKTRIGPVKAASLDASRAAG